MKLCETIPLRIWRNTLLLYPEPQCRCPYTDKGLYIPWSAPWAVLVKATWIQQKSSCSVEQCRTESDRDPVWEKLGDETLAAEMSNAQTDSQSLIPKVRTQNKRHFYIFENCHFLLVGDSSCATKRKIISQPDWKNQSLLCWTFNIYFIDRAYYYHLTLYCVNELIWF